jgi:hypothetical protein
MAVSRDEPNLLEQFLVLCGEAGLLSGEDCDQLADAFVDQGVPVPLESDPTFTWHYSPHHHFNIRDQPISTAR